MGVERELLEKIAVVQQQGIIGAEDLLIGHPLGTQGNCFEDLPAAIEVIEDLVLKIAHHPRQEDVGRILRTFKIKKNVEVTDNGKIII